MSENVAKFYQKLAGDHDLQKELQAATAAAAEHAVLSVAGAQGFPFSLDELRAHLAVKAAELGEEDLAKVAGGIASPLAGDLSRIALMTSGGHLGSGVAAFEERKCDRPRGDLGGLGGIGGF